ncbi:Uncharacterized protein Rs2_14316 [Raphanus sativus]|nr:Uncharacterized protein Rs2_14316 [Raphanus sativus]
MSTSFLDLVALVLRRGGFRELTVFPFRSLVCLGAQGRCVGTSLFSDPVASPGLSWCRRWISETGLVVHCGVAVGCLLLKGIKCAWGFFFRGEFRATILGRLWPVDGLLASGDGSCFDDWASCSFRLAFLLTPVEASYESQSTSFGSRWRQATLQLSDLITVIAVVSRLACCAYPDAIGRTLVLLMVVCLASTVQV